MWFIEQNVRRSNTITQGFILPAASATAAPIMAPMALSATAEAICSQYR